MAQTSWPFENIDTTETQFSQWARNINEGIRQGSGSELAVTAPGGGMTVQVASGQAMIRGHYYSNTAPVTFTIAAADATNPRIDSVVLELDPTANTVILKVLTGTPAGSPVAPSLTQTDSGIYQLRLANVAVAAGALSISSGNLTDLRTYMFAGIGKWTTATRPANPVANQTTGYNTTIGAHEFWNGTSWVGFANPISTRGDLIVGGVSGAPTRFPIGASGRVLSSNGTDVVWAEGASGALNYLVTSNATVTVPNGLYRAQVPNVANWNSIAINGVSVSGSVVNFITVTTGQLVFSNLVRAWVPRTSGFNGLEIRALGFGNNVYLAGGNAGILTTSTDAITWTTRTSGFGSTVIRTLSFGNGVYVAAGDNGTLTTSTDGITWTTRTSNWPVNGVIRGSGFGAGLYVIVGGDAGANALAHTSTDGITWTTRTVPNGGGVPLYTVTRGTTRFVAGGDGGRVTTSTDGITWTTVVQIITGGEWITSSTFGNGIFLVGASSNSMRASTDGITWTTLNPGFQFVGRCHVTFGNNLYVASSSVGQIRTSTDTLTWTSRNSRISDQIQGTTFGNGVYLVGGDQGTIATSTDGIGEEVPSTVLLENFGSTVTIP